LSLLQIVFSSGVTALWQFTAMALLLNISMRQNRMRREIIIAQLSSNNSSIVANASPLCNINPFRISIFIINENEVLSFVGILSQY
jgi:hypothetical protein